MTRSARIRALLIFLASRNPRDPEMAEPVDAARILQESGNHTLNQVFTKVETPWLSNPGNRVILMKKPGSSGSRCLGRRWASSASGRE